jgi:hypothetical protein
VTVSSEEQHEKQDSNKFWSRVECHSRSWVQLVEHASHRISTNDGIHIDFNDKQGEKVEGSIWIIEDGD